MLGSLKLTPPEEPLALGTDKQRSGRAAVRPRESFVSSTSDRATGRGDTRAGVGDHEGSCHGGLVLSGCGYPAKGVRWQRQLQREHPSALFRLSTRTR